jgi:hypothetical protein
VLSLTGAAWVSYLDAAILIGTLALALFNAAKDDITRYFAYAYALISVGVLVSPSASLYSRSLTELRRSTATSFTSTASPSSAGVIRAASVGSVALNAGPSRADARSDQVLGPVVISVVLFGAVLANFIVRGECNPHGPVEQC